VNEKGLANKGEATYRTAQKKKSKENHKRDTGQLKSPAEHKDNRVNEQTVCTYTHVPPVLGKPKPPPQGKPCGFHNRLADLPVGQKEKTF
jgi:hypothetical protein